MNIIVLVKIFITFQLRQNLWISLLCLLSWVNNLIIFITLYNHYYYASLYCLCLIAITQKCLTYNRFFINVCWMHWWIELCENQRDWFYEFGESKLKRLPSRSLSYNLYRYWWPFQTLHFSLWLSWISPLGHRRGVRNKWMRFYFQTKQRGAFYR